jgi:hypothetical protein
MFKKQHLALAITASLLAGATSALETSVILKNETATMVNSGIRTGEATTSTDTTGKGKGIYKFENTAQIFLNDDLGNGTSWHGELKIVRDSEAVSGYDGHKNFSQQDYLRELYVDTQAADWDLRLGKQQVVWGTADGIKLLDNINPTDWRELNQNAMADARIPVWMLNAEKYLENGDNVQFIVAQAERSKIAGMDVSDGETRSVSFTYGLGGDQSDLSGTDAGAPFIMKGVDTITGKVNGFFNIGPVMGAVASQFWGNGIAYRMGNGTTGAFDTAIASGSLATIALRTTARSGATMTNLAGYSFTNPGGAVGQHADGSQLVSSAGKTGNFFNPEYNTVGTFAAGEAMPYECGASYANGAACMKYMASAANAGVTNVTDANVTTGASWDTSNPNSMFEYMSNTTFATFNAFVGMNTRYERITPDNPFNFATRYKTNMDNGLNLGMSYSYAYDPNPVVNVYWENSSKERLTVVEKANAYGVKTLQLTDGTNFYGADADFSVTGLTDISGAVASGGNNAGYATLVFEETLERTHNLGLSADYALDLGNGTPVVLRGEFLYQKDVKTPVIDRTKLGYGNITEALKMEDADYFKYVVGADVTVLTDMMLSGQFIQFRNLDYVSQGSSLSDSSWKYTADQASMHLTNGLKKAEENKEFFSLFLSKPFGDSGQGRWNNIFIYEEGGGKWNRFDVEYGLTDQLIGTLEYNKYFGDENTMFGQFANSSNIQLGVKYLLQ